MFEKIGGPIQAAPPAPTQQASAASATQPAPAAPAPAPPTSVSTGVITLTPPDRLPFGAAPATSTEPNRGHSAAASRFISGQTSRPPGGNSQPFRGLTGRQMSANQKLIQAAARQAVDAMKTPPGTQILYPLIGPKAMQSLQTWQTLDDANVIAAGKARRQRAAKSHRHDGHG